MLGETQNWSKATGARFRCATDPGMDVQSSVHCNERRWFLSDQSLSHIVSPLLAVDISEVCSLSQGVSDFRRHMVFALICSVCYSKIWSEPVFILFVASWFLWLECLGSAETLTPILAFQLELVWCNIVKLPSRPETRFPKKYYSVGVPLPHLCGTEGPFVTIIGHSGQEANHHGCDALPSWSALKTQQWQIHQSWIMST